MSKNVQLIYILKVRFFCLEHLLSKDVVFNHHSEGLLDIILAVKFCSSSA